MLQIIAMLQGAAPPPNAFDWTSFIAGTGFPIAVAIFLLVKFEPVISRLIESVNDMKHSVTTVRESVDRLNDSVAYLSGRVPPTPQRRMGDEPPEPNT